MWDGCALREGVWNSASSTAPSLDGGLTRAGDNGASSHTFVDGLVRNILTVQLLLLQSLSNPFPPRFIIRCMRQTENQGFLAETSVSENCITMKITIAITF